MLKVSDKIKLTVIAEDSAVVVDGGAAEHNSLLRTVSKFSHRCTHIVIHSSQCASFPQSSHLQDYCHVFTTKVSIIFFYARYVLSRSNCL